jgi:hypothetical protein
MATYEQIQNYVKNNYSYKLKTCWIAHVKELCGLPVRKAWNRKREQRIIPCPEDKIEDIKCAFRHFGMI